MLWVIAAKKWLGSLPKWVWYALAGVLLVLLAMWWHGRQVESFKKDTIAARDKDWQKAFDDMKAAAEQWKENYETKALEISAETGAKHDQEVRHNAADADDLRLRGPGAAAACPSRGNTAGLSTGTGDLFALGATDAAMVEVSPSGFAAVPWGDLVTFGERHDNYRAEVTAWREWYPRQKAAWDAYKAEIAAKAVIAP